jgi:hypothetical protein
VGHFFYVWSNEFLKLETPRPTTYRNISRASADIFNTYYQQSRFIHASERVNKFKLGNRDTESTIIRYSPQSTNVQQRKLKLTNRHHEHFDR